MLKKLLVLIDYTCDIIIFQMEAVLLDLAPLLVVTVLQVQALL